MKALLIVLALLLILVNAFFVIAEYAIVRSRKPRLETMAEEGVRGAKLALRLMDDIGDYLSACQVGITMAALGLGAVGEPAVAHVIEPIFGEKHTGGVVVVISVVIAYSLITFVESTRR